MSMVELFCKSSGAISMSCLLIHCQNCDHSSSRARETRREPAWYLEMRGRTAGVSFFLRSAHTSEPDAVLQETSLQSDSCANPRVNSLLRQNHKMRLFNKDSSGHPVGRKRKRWMFSASGTSRLLSPSSPVS